MELQVGVKILLRNRKGKCLIVKRSEKKYPEVGARWDIPSGRIDAGKTLLENLKREVKEETGLILREEPKLIAAQDILRVPGRHVVRLTYLGKISGVPKLNQDNTEFRWVTRKEMEKIGNMDIYVKELLEKKLL